jgi:hypothetical protein
MEEGDVDAVAVLMEAGLEIDLVIAPRPSRQSSPESQLNHDRCPCSTWNDTLDRWRTLLSDIVPAPTSPLEAEMETVLEGKGKTLRRAEWKRSWCGNKSGLVMEDVKDPRGLWMWRKVASSEIPGWYSDMSQACAQESRLSIGAK